MENTINPTRLSGLADQGTLAEYLERALKDWLLDKIDWEDNLTLFAEDKLIDTIIEELWAAGLLDFVKQAADVCGRACMIYNAEVIHEETNDVCDGALDGLVHDVMSQSASCVNNGGLGAQLSFLLVERHAALEEVLACLIDGEV